MIRDRKLQRDERWYRIVSTSDHPRIYESKLATGEAQISLSQVRSEWNQWNEGEKVQFAQAFGQKQTLSAEDVAILEFLIEQRDERVSSVIALLSTKHPDRDKSLQFLKYGLRSFKAERPNFVQALSAIASPESKAELLSIYAESSVASNSPANRQSVVELLYCSLALFRTLADPIYRNTISAYLHDEDETIRTTAQYCYDQTKT